MADERDPKVSARYRELGAEEPPRALDEAILAASRRDLKKRSWYAPVAIAAVLVLAVAVTLQLERQKPEEEVVASAPAEARKETQMQGAPAAPAVPEAAKPVKPAPKAVRERQQAFTPEPPPAPAPQAAPSPAPASRADESLRDLAKPSGAAPQAAAPARLEAQRESASAVAGMVQLSPERRLEQIAELRKQGRHEEADKALAEFRRQFPDYRLTDEMRAKVEKR